MSTRTTSIRRAREADLGSLSTVFDAPAREPIAASSPGGPRAADRRARRAWWRSALRRGRPIALVETGERVVGYAAYGRTRSPARGTEAEIDELTCCRNTRRRPRRRLFKAVRNDLADHGLTRLGVWSLEDNARAGAFYEGLGGQAGPRVLDRVAGVALPKVGYLFS